MNCSQNPSNKKKGCSKRARVILASVGEATQNLLDKGEKIAKEAPVLVEELNAALHDVHKESKPAFTGTIMELFQGTIAFNSKVRLNVTYEIFF